MYVSGANPYNQGFTLTAYVFAIFPQTLPAWGFAIWDATGKLVLTNESRVLSDLQTIGTPEQVGHQHRPDSCGVMGCCTCTTGSVSDSEQLYPAPTIYTINAYSSCRFDGANTRINAGGASTGTGSPAGEQTQDLR